MNITEVKALLVLIESYDRSPFRPEAVDLWFEALRTVEHEDAEKAVHGIFRTSGRTEKGDIRRLLPADVRRPAEAIAESRYRRAAQKAIGARRPPGVPLSGPVRSPAAEAALAQARAKAAEALDRYREKIAA